MIEQEFFLLGRDCFGPLLPSDGNIVVGISKDRSAVVFREKIWKSENPNSREITTDQKNVIVITGNISAKVPNAQTLKMFKNIFFSAPVRWRVVAEEIVSRNLWARLNNNLSDFSLDARVVKDPREMRIKLSAREEQGEKIQNQQKRASSEF
jgi:hypothetical protein